MIPLPSVNQRVGVLVEGSQDVLTSRVEDAGDRWIALALPSDGLAVYGIPTGRSVSVQWSTPRGLGMQIGHVRATARIPVEAVFVDLLGEPELVQRREYVRADAVVRIVLRADSEEGGPMIGSTLDLGGGGARARVPGGLEPGDQVRVRLCLPDDDEIETVARVVRRIDAETVAFEFDRIDLRDRERLVRHVFKWLRRALVARRD